MKNATFVGRSLWIFLVICSFPLLAPAQSDLCDGSTPAAVDGDNAVDTTGFVGGLGSFSCAVGNGEADGWFTYTATATGLLDVDFCAAGFDSVVAIYSGTCGAPVAEGCSDDDFTNCGSSGPSFINNVPVTIGTGYLIQIGGWNGATGTGTLNLTVTVPAPPANNDCAGATSVVATPNASPTIVEDALGIPWTTVDANTEAGLTCRGTDDVWFEYTPSSDGTLSVDFGAGFDANHSVYTNSTPGSCPVDADNLACVDSESPFSVEVDMGVSYLIRIGAWSTTSGAQGAGALDLTLFAPFSADPELQACPIISEQTPSPTTGDNLTTISGNIFSNGTDAGIESDDAGPTASDDYYNFGGLDLFRAGTVLSDGGVISSVNSSESQRAMNASSELAYEALVSNGTGTSEDYVMRDLTILVTEGDIAHDGAEFSFFSDVSIDDAGNVYFEADTSGTSSSDEAIYKATGPGVYAPLDLGGGAGPLIEGGAIAAGVLIGWDFDSSSAFTDPVCNAGGDVIVEAEVNDTPGASTADWEALIIIAGDGTGYTVPYIETISTIATPAGTGTVTGMTTHALADNGDFVVEMDTDLPTTDDEVLVASFGGVETLVAQQGQDLSALLGGGAEISSISTFHINSAGQVVFLASVTTIAGFPGASEGLFLYDSTAAVGSELSLLFADESPTIGAGNATDLDFVDPIITNSGRIYAQVTTGSVDHLVELKFVAPDECLLQGVAVDGSNAFDLTSATSDGAADGCATAVDTWFCYTATCTGIVSVSAATGADTLAVYDGCGCPADAGNLIACGSAGTGLTFLALPGQTYLIKVGDTVAGGAGDLDISCTPSAPLNDDCSIALAGPVFAQGTYTFDSTGSTPDGPAPSCVNTLGGNLWIKHVAACTGELTASLCDSSFDTVIAIYPGSACPTTSAEELTCNDDNFGACGAGGPSEATTSVTAGDTYLIQIAGWSGATGAGTLTLSCTPPVNLSEVRNDSAAFPDEEFFEISGPAGYDLTGLTLVTIGDTFTSGSVGPGGGIDQITTLTGTIPASGFYVVAESSFSLGPVDQVETLNFEDSDYVTHILVLGYAGNPVGNDFDLGDDGVLDEPLPWALTIDSVAYSSGSTTSAEVPYSPNDLGTARGAFNCAGMWFALGDNAGEGDSPGAPNAPDDKNNPGNIGVGNTSFCSLTATTDGVALDPLVCDPGPSGDDQIYNDLWYCLTVDCPGDYTLSTCNNADFDTRLAVYTNCNNGDDPNNVVACNDDGTGCAGFTSELTWTATGGTYLIRVGGFGPGDSGLGTLILTATLPTDECETAGTMVEGLNPFDTTCALTDGPIVPNCATQLVGGSDFVFRSAYYQYTPAVDGSLRLSTCGIAGVSDGASDFDSRIVLYSDATCPLDVSTAIACDDDNNTGVFPGGSGACDTQFAAAAFTSHVTGGQTYLIEVGGFSATNFGLATLELLLVPDCTPVTLDSLAADVTAGDAPLTVTFTSTVSGDTPTYDWDFGDGQMSTDAVTTVHVFNTPGTYTVTLTVTNACGTASDTVMVTVCAPVVASFDVSNDTGIATHCVDFTDTTTGDIASLLWDLDGDTVADAAGSTASFMYTTPGTFTASLSVVGSCGGSDSASATITVLGMGDCNGDGNFDIGDPVRLATYLFGGGIVPECLNACDTNGDGSNDLGDVVYSLVTLFAAGPAPVAAPDCTLCN